MAKKISGAIGGTSSTSPQSKTPAAKSGTRGTRPSALLDTRVVYCGDNLEQLAKLPDDPPRRMQKEEGRMMKPAHPLFLHSSFRLLPLPYYHCDWHASHYVTVMLDQIFGENKFQSGTAGKAQC